MTERLPVTPGCQAVISHGALTGASVTVVRQLEDADLFLFVHRGLHLRCEEKQVGEWFVVLNHVREDVTDATGRRLTVAFASYRADRLIRIDGGLFEHNVYGDKDAY